jgi:hypothetical protein
MAQGVLVWLRTREGGSRARFTLLANALTTNQMVGIFPQDANLTNRWQKVNLPFASFPGLQLPSIDLLAVEFIGDGPREFLVDDLQLLGPWRSEGE